MCAACPDERGARGTQHFALACKLQIAPAEGPDVSERMVIITGPPEAQFKVSAKGHLSPAVAEGLKQAAATSEACSRLFFGRPSLHCPSCCRSLVSDLPCLAYLRAVPSAWSPPSLLFYGKVDCLSVPRSNSSSGVSLTPEPWFRGQVSQAR